MDEQRLAKNWWIGGAVVAVLLIVVGWFGFISPRRAATDRVHEQVSAAEVQSAQLSARISRLQGEVKDLSTYQQSYAAAQLALPSTAGMKEFLDTLQSVGNATRADVSSLTVGAPALATGSQSIYALPVTAQVEGAVPDLAAFLDQLQRVQPRAVLIKQLAQTSGTDSTGLSLTMQVFVQPAAAAERAQLQAEATK